MRNRIIIAATAAVCAAIAAAPLRADAAAIRPSESSGGLSSRPDLKLAQTSPTEIEVRALPNGIRMTAADIHLVLYTTDLETLTESDIALAPGWTLNAFMSGGSAALIGATNPGGQTADGPIAIIRPRPLPDLSGRATPIALAGDTTFTDADANVYEVAEQSVSFVPGGHVAFLRQPGGAEAGAPLGGPPQAAVLDGTGAVVTNFAGAVNVAIKPGTGAPGATLAGTVTVNAVGGVASFPGLSIDKAAPGYVLRATSGALPPADSAAFAVSALPFTVADAARALRIGGGLAAALPTETDAYDVARSGASAARIDSSDALRIARIAAGLEPNP